MIHTPKRFFNILLALSFLAVYGCTKSDGPSQTTQGDPVKAKERVNQANQIFIPRLALILSGRTDTTAFNLATANGLYREALTFDQNNVDAHFGVALTELLSLGADAELRTLLSSGETTFLPTGSNFGGQFSASKELATRLINKLTAFSSNPLASSPQKFFDGFQKNADQHPFSYYQVIIETKLLPVLLDVITHFSRITQNSGYAFYITSQMAGTLLPDSIRIDLTEIYALLAVTQGLCAEGSFTVAYNIDYTGSDSLAVLQAWQVGSPFLALRTNGAQRMRDSKSFILGLGLSIKNGITYLLNETTHPGIDPIQKPTRSQDIAQLNQISRQADSVNLFLTTSRQIQTDHGTLTINPASFFDNAISNFKQKLPAYTVEAQRGDEKYHPVLVWQASSYSAWIFPDPTLNGLFPGLDDTGFKNIFGISQSSWTQRLVIK